MKKLITIILFGFNGLVIAQCDISEDYSSSSAWTQIGADVEISGNKVQYRNGSVNGQQRRVYRSLGVVLDSMDYFQADLDFRPTAVGIKNLKPYVGHRILALTAGTQEPFNDCPDVPCTGLPEGTQDGIVALYLTENPPDGNIFFILKTRDSSIEYTSSSLIVANSMDTTYYLRMERISKTIIKLSAFSNAARTNHLNGSPIYDTIPSTVTGLNTVQHANAARGESNRLLTGTLDNLCIRTNLYSGVEKHTSSEMKVLIFPNPASSKVTLKFNNTIASGCIRLLNSLNQTVILQSFTNSKQAELDLNALSAGSYMLLVEDGRHISSHFLVRE